RDSERMGRPAGVPRFHSLGRIPPGHELGPRADPPRRAEAQDLPPERRHRTAWRWDSRPRQSSPVTAGNGCHRRLAPACRASTETESRNKPEEVGLPWPYCIAVSADVDRLALGCGPRVRAIRMVSLPETFTRRQILFI